jgi:hypothetical protein
MKLKALVVLSSVLAIGLLLAPVANAKFMSDGSTASATPWYAHYVPATSLRTDVLGGIGRPVTVTLMPDIRGGSGVSTSLTLRPDIRDVNGGGSLVETPIVSTPSSGFAWTDASIGAMTAFALTLLVAASVFLTRRAKHAHRLSV